MRSASAAPKATVFARPRRSKAAKRAAAARATTALGPLIRKAAPMDAPKRSQEESTSPSIAKTSAAESGTSNMAWREKRSHWGAVARTSAARRPVFRP